MSNIVFMPLVSSVFSLIFAFTVLDQFFARRKPYQLIWAIGLSMYFLSTGCEFWTGMWGLNEPIYRLWYLFGAILVAAYLGMGTVYLLFPRRIAHLIMAVLLTASVYAAFKVFSVNLDLSSLRSLSGQAMPTGIKMITPAFNTFGTIALVGGAIYSAWYFWKRRQMQYRMVSNIFIAFGAILPAAGGTVMRVSGSLTTFYGLEMLGIIIIFAGFLRSREAFGLYRFPLIHGFRRVQPD